jgi:hypothetical protein
MNDARPAQHPGKDFGGLDARRANEHRLAALVGVLDLLHDRRVLVAPGLENGIVLVDPDAGLVCGNDLDGQPVDVVELRRLGFRRARHAGELLVHPEVVLDRNRGVGARLALFASTAWCRPSDQRRPGITRPVFSSTIITLPSGVTTYSTSRS